MVSLKYIEHDIKMQSAASQIAQREPGNITSLQMQAAIRKHRRGKA